MIPELPEAFNFTSTLYTLNTFIPEVQISLRFALFIRFRDTKSSEIENVPNDPRMTLST